MGDVRIWLTRAQAQAAIDALDMRTEGTQGDMTAKELTSARTARVRMAAALRSEDN